MPLMRTFFALDLPAQLKLDIDSWRSKTLPPMPSSVPAANFHITLSFNGKTSEAQLDKLQQGAEAIESPVFQVSLNNMGYFAKPGIAFVGMEETPTELLALHQKLQQLSQRCGLQVEKQTYCPHVTLFRNAPSLPAPLLEPSFNFNAERFGLYESITRKSGVIYQPIFEWELERSYRPRAI